MAALGLLILGAFVGYIIMYGLNEVKDWTKPVSTLTGVLSAAVAGGLFSLIERFAQSDIGDSIYFYPIGLGYGALCKGLTWVTDEDLNLVKILHLAAFFLASVALLALMFWPTMRAVLP